MTNQSHNRDSHRPAMHVWHILLLLLIGVAGGMLSPRAQAQLDPAIDWPMHQDPLLIPLEPGFRFNPRSVEIWQAVLERNDAYMVVNVLTSLMEAHDLGDEKVMDLVPTLTRIVAEPSRSWAERSSAARAIGHLDAREAAAVLWTQNQTLHPDMVLASDQSLAAWRHEPAFATWRERVSDPGVPLTLRLSACRALEIAEVTDAADELAALARDEDASIALRLAAAKAAGKLRHEGLTDVAREVLAQTPISTQAAMIRQAQQVVAARLVRHHADVGAAEVQRSLTASTNQVAVALAVEALSEFQPDIMRSLAAAMSEHTDPTVRERTVHWLLTQADSAAVTLLGRRLGDAHPDVRQAARRAMHTLHENADLATLVRATAKESLRANRWQSVEQAAILIGQLGDRSANDDLLRHMRHPRWESRMAAIAALRWLGPSDLMPAMLEQAQQVLGRIETISSEQVELSAAIRSIRTGEEASPQIDERLEILTVRAEGLSVHYGQSEQEYVQLVQTLGMYRHQPAGAMMRRLIPKGSVGWGDGRAASIWALGFLHEGTPDEGLARQLAGRLDDVHDPMNPEFDSVRQFSAVTIGRMKADSQLAMLEEYAERDKVGLACYWAIEQITGRPVPEFEQQMRDAPLWFLSPLMN